MPTDHYKLLPSLNRFTRQARRIARAAASRGIVPDFTVLAAPLENVLLPPFVAAYRSGGLRAARTAISPKAEKMVWNKIGDTFSDEEPIPTPEKDRRGAFLLFAAGVGLVAIAVKNTVAKIIDWMNRSWRRSVGLPKTAPISVGTATADGVVLPVQRIAPPGTRVVIPERTKPFPIDLEPRHVPASIPEALSPAPQPAQPEAIPVPTPLELPAEAPLAIIDDEIHDLKQKAIIEWCKQQGAVGLEWETEHDEKVCPICSPLDGKRVVIGEPFTHINGVALYAPRAHPFCRCWVKPFFTMNARRLGKSWNPKLVGGIEP